MGNVVSHANDLITHCEEKGKPETLDNEIPTAKDGRAIVTDTINLPHVSRSRVHRINVERRVLKGFDRRSPTKDLSLARGNYSIATEGRDNERVRPRAYARVPTSVPTWRGRQGEREERKPATIRLTQKLANASGTNAVVSPRRTPTNDCLRGNAAPDREQSKEPIGR